jgi:hypothetical protein
MIFRSAMLTGLAVGLLPIDAQADDLACKKMLLDVMLKTVQTPSHT